MKKVSTPKVVTALEASGSPLPAQVQEALGELVASAREGLLALSVGVGLGVVHELMELEVTEVVGLKGKRNPERVAKRHGHEDGSMTLGGRRVGVRRPRMRTADDEHELPVESYGYFADRDPLTRAVMDRMLAGVSSRKFERVGEPVGSEVERAASSTSKTSVSEMFVERTRTALGELMSRRLDDVSRCSYSRKAALIRTAAPGFWLPFSGLWPCSQHRRSIAPTSDCDPEGASLCPRTAIGHDGSWRPRRPCRC